MDEDNHFITGMVDGSEFRLNVDELHLILRLPEPDYGGNVSFSPRVQTAILRRDLIALGYRGGEIGHLSTFNRNKLQLIWFCLFTILNRCLTSKKKGYDSYSVCFLHLIHAVIYS